MCRFLLVNTTEESNPRELVEDFSNHCQQSERWQGDGWGISWLNNNRWNSKKSTQAIWADDLSLVDSISGSTFLIHARGSSFKKHKNNQSYNQPFTKEQYAFVFNGFINGVNLPYKIPGNIGSEKIFNLFLKHQSLEKLKQVLIEHSNVIEAINVGVCNKQSFQILNYFDGDPNYFQINYHQSSDLSLVSSMPFGNYNWQAMENGEVLTIALK